MTANNFLQSEEWKSFQEANGRRSIQLSGGAVGFVHELPMVGKYLYFPRWPDGEGLLETPNIVNEITCLAHEKKFGWVRIEPVTQTLLAPWKACFGAKLIRAPHDMQPKENFIIDITHSEEELFAAMKSKTRYNIRLAEKKGVRVFSSREKKYQEAFFSLIESTAKRQRILPHPRKYYENFFVIFPEERCELWIAEYEGMILAANLILYTEYTAIYLHGGTSDIARDVMAPVLLQWAQICEAKKRGCTKYDFGGVATEQSIIKNKKSKLAGWEGITRFKLGFSPATQTTCYPGSYDIIFDAKKYWLYDRLRLLQAGLSLMKKIFRS